MATLHHPPLPDPSLRLPEPPAHGVIVIGGSVGGIPALISLLSALPAGFPLPILVVQHLSATLPSNLPAVLGWRTPLRVKWAEDGERIAAGTVYVAPRDQHLLLASADRIALSCAARVGWWRPAVDVLFRSAAEVGGERVIAVVLSGAMWDGAEGIAAVASHGGMTIVQDEPTSHCFEMPAAAIDIGHADVFMSPSKIAEALQVLAADAIEVPSPHAEIAATV